MQRLGFAIAFGLGLFAFTATAQNAVDPNAKLGPRGSQPSTAPPTTVQGVIVTAHRPPTGTDPALVRRQFVDTHTTPAPVGDKLVRWGRYPVCPETVGLPPAYNDFVTNRIREVARQIGAPSADRVKCDVNILVVFTEDPQKFLDEIAVKHAHLLGWHYAAQTKRLKTFNHPIESWYVTASVSWGGTEVVNSPWGYGENIEPARSVLHVALIVADRNKVSDYKVGTIADYVTMLALTDPSRASLDTCGSLGSILDLLSTNCSDEEKPDALTPDDVAFLKGLYNVDIEMNADKARRGIALRMLKAQP